MIDRMHAGELHDTSSEEEFSPYPNRDHTFDEHTSFLTPRLPGSSATEVITREGVDTNCREGVSAPLLRFIPEEV